MIKNIYEGAYIPTPSPQDFAKVNEILTKFGFLDTPLNVWKNHGPSTYIKPTIKLGQKLIFIGAYSNLDRRFLTTYSNPQDFVMEYMPRFEIDQGVKASQVDYVSIANGDISSETYGNNKIDLTPDAMYIMGVDIDKNLGPVYKIGIKGVPEHIAFAVKFDDLHRIIVKEDEETFYIGAAVKLSSDSQFAQTMDVSNPIGTLGKVINHLDGSNPYHLQVQWDNGEVNSYSGKDLTFMGTYLKVGDRVKVKNSMSVVESQQGIPILAWIVNNRAVKDIKLSEKGLSFLLEDDNSIWLDSTNFEVVKQTVEEVGSPEPEESPEIEYELYRGHRSFPNLSEGERIKTNHWVDPEYWRPVVNQESEKLKVGDYAYVVGDTDSESGLTFEKGTILKLELISDVNVSTFGKFVLPLESLRKATDEEVEKEMDQQVAGIKVEYLGDGVKFGAQVLWAEDIKVIQHLMMKDWDLELCINGYHMNFEQYFYLHQFSGLPWDLGD